MNVIEHGLELPRYRDWAPTQFDIRGLGLDDRQDWIVLPVCQTRDSGPRGQSNYASAVKLCETRDPDGVQWEEHRFGHWGPGWYEIILVSPELADLAGSIACALADYPILDEMDLGEREEEQAWGCWEAYGHDEWIADVHTAFEISDAAREVLRSDSGACYAVHIRYSPGDESHEGEGTHFRTEYVHEEPGLTRDDLARLIREIRRGSDG